MSSRKRVNKRTIRYADKDTLRALWEEHGAGNPVAPSGDSLLPLRAIITAESVMQPRRFSAEDRLEARALEKHVEELARLAKEGQQFKDPILVFPIAGWYVVVNGHQRVKALGRARKARAWVEVLGGTFDDAFYRSVEDNAVTTRPLTAEARLESAWCLTLHSAEQDGCWSKKKLSQGTGVSERTIARMRKTIREVGLEVVKGRTWADVKGRKDWPKDEESVAELFDVQKEKDIQLLLRYFGDRNRRMPEALWEAFNEALPRVVAFGADDFQADIDEEYAGSI